MKVKNMGLLVSSMVILVMIGGLVNALEATYKSPLDTSTIQGSTVLINISVNDVTTVNATNCTGTCSSVKAGDSFTFTTYNESEEKNYTNATVSISGEIDADDWTCGAPTCSLDNGTTLTGDAVTRITLDTTVPTCTLTSGQVSDKLYDRNSVWTAACVNATSAYIKFDANQYSMAEVSDVCTYDDGVAEGIYQNVIITVSDGLNSTSCTTLNRIEIGSGTVTKEYLALQVLQGQEPTTQAPPTKTKFNLPLLIGIAAVGLYIYTKKK